MRLLLYPFVKRTKKWFFLVGLFMFTLIFIFSSGYLRYKNVLFQKEEEEPVINNNTPRLNEYQLGGVKIKTELNLGATQELVKFIQAVFTHNDIPTELDINLVSGGEKVAGEYVGTWNTGRKDFFILYVVDPGVSSPRYIRGWVLAPYSSRLDKSVAISLVKNTFSGMVLKQLESIFCDVRFNPEIGIATTECGQVQLSKDSSKLGITVRPTKDPREENILMVAACYVPKNHAHLYNYSSCL